MKDFYMEIEPEKEKEVLDTIINYIVNGCKDNEYLIYLNNPLSFRLSLSQFKIITDYVFNLETTAEKYQIVMSNYMAVLDAEIPLPANPRYAKKYYNYLTKKICSTLLKRGYYIKKNIFYNEYSQILVNVIMEYPDIAEKHLNKINFRKADLIMLYDCILQYLPKVVTFSYRDYNNAYLVNNIYDKILSKKLYYKYLDKSKYLIRDKLLDEGEFYDEI